jgi:hypothetical protein
MQSLSGSFLLGAGSVSCQSGSCTFAGTRIDDGACTSVTFSNCVAGGP